MGYSAQHPSGLGTGATRATGIRSEAPSANPHGSRGGQASLSLFGIPGLGLANAVRQRIAAQEAAAAPQTVVVPPCQDDRPRRIGGLTFGQRRAQFRAGCDAAFLAHRKQWDALNADGVPVPATSEPEAAPVAPAAAPTPARIDGARDLFERDLFDLAPQASQPLTAPPAAAAVQPSVSTTLHLRRDKFHVFVRLSEREQRPVEDVLTEWVSECASLIGRDELFEGSVVAMTPAMEAAVRESDRRESRRTEEDEEADFWHRCAGDEPVTFAQSLHD